MGNKEASLRRIIYNRFELKLMDGLINPYLALCAILSTKSDGIQDQMPLIGGSCSTAPVKLDPERRETLGI